MYHAINTERYPVNSRQTNGRHNVRKSFTCFLLGLRKWEKAWKRKTRLPGHRNIFKAQVNDRLCSFSQSSATFKPLQSHINIECQVDKELIGRTLNVKVSKEDIGTKERNCLINNVSLICKKLPIPKIIRDREELFLSDA